MAGNTKFLNTLSNVTKEPTGFSSPELVIVNYNSTNRTITLTGTTDAYFKGRKISELVSGWVSDAHPIGVDNYFLYHNGTTFVWSTTPWTFDLIQIAFVSKSGYALRETHGTQQWQAHEELHQTIGTYLNSGGDISAYTLASTTAANRRPDISSTVLKDEDLVTTNPVLTSKLYTHKFLSSTSTVNYTLDSADIIPLLTNNPYYNQFTGGNWVQTLFPNNAYGAIFVYAVPVTADTASQKYRYIFIQPQTVSTTLSTIQSLTANNINWGDSTSQVPEFNVIGKIIVRYTGGNWVLTSVEKVTGNSATSVTVNGSFLSAVNTSGNLLSGVGTVANPLTAIYRDGFIDYNHSGSTQVYTSGNLKILNDGAGTYTLKTYKPTGITEFFNTTTNQFNFSELSLGDEVTLRYDCNITTTATNQEFYLYLSMAIGGNAYQLGDGTYAFKAVGTRHFSVTFTFYMGNSDSITLPAELYFNSDAAATILTNGFYISAKRRF